ncbi:translation initiation factor eIF-2B subunit delta isoform X1 [Trichoplusia ni]|uniref:Translation initiation factor eIF2B subunit delta n=2 Tax=Trichoplusia ni TaxID=7111 RepID=A0A7E5VUG7_TRINI|nr:translation initiation factor eIF-2B subunit delta isoform X1 [Trichoplusia ni]
METMSTPADEEKVHNQLTSSAKRRLRRQKLRAEIEKIKQKAAKYKRKKESRERKLLLKNSLATSEETGNVEEIVLNQEVKQENKTKMSSTDNKSREDVMAARQAKKLAKQKGKTKDIAPEQVQKPAADVKPIETPVKQDEKPTKADPKVNSPKSKDEVDKACLREEQEIVADKSKDDIKAERAAKKAAKQAKKKGASDGGDAPQAKPQKETAPPANENMTVKDVVETLRDIANVAKEIQGVTDKVIDLGAKKAEDSSKSKAELKAERRAKQEAQRAAKQAAQEKIVAKSKAEAKAAPEKSVTTAKVEKAVKPKSSEKPKVKSQSSHRVNWFQHLYKEHDKESLKTIAINSNLHPAIIKLGVQLASRVVSGSNARCVALLDALKKMVRDYTLPAKTEFARGLEAHLASSLDFLWAMRQPSASQTNAVKFFRYHLTQLPNNVDEFDAKKTLQEEIDRYIREQIDMAGEAISIAVRNKISNGDNILTYGCSSLIERILLDAWSSGLQFRTVVAGSRAQPAAAHMLRRLVARGLPCTYIDITALGFIMNTVSKVVLGAGALLVNGSVLGAAGSAQLALAARARNVPVLVACETHKFCDRVQTDAFVYNEIGDPDDLIDKSDENSPLKDWRSNPNLTPLNLTYDVTPPSLVTAVVTELAILPCTSAPVVLRFKLSEYGV